MRFGAEYPQAVRLALTNPAGRALLTETVRAQAGANEVTLSLRDLPTGVYLLTVDSDHQQKTQKVLIER